MPKKKHPFDLGENFSLVNDATDRLLKAKAEGDDRLLIQLPEHKDCDHGVLFDEEEYKKHSNMSASEVRKRWPRGWGICPKGCGFNGIAYASFLHYIAGDW
jgi:hypothetical protein